MSHRRSDIFPSSLVRRAQGSPAARTKRVAPIALVALSIAMLVPASPALAQSAPDDTREGLLESYLASRGLDTLLAQHLEAVLAGSSGTRRIEVAERLGAVYARILARTDNPLERSDTVLKAGELLEAVPAADTFDLRIALIKARYLRAEDTAERARLLLVDDAERAEAAQAMESIAGELAVLAADATRRVLGHERRERAGSIADPVVFRGELAEARRQRSLASYYAGWANYYHALLTGQVAPLRDAVEQFGVLLGGEGHEPQLANMPKSLLRYEHVARAVVGVALCKGLAGDHREAVDWIEELEAAEDANPTVISQLFNRRVTILTGARRWDALARTVERRRTAGLDQPAANPLRVAEARLLAVEVLLAARASDADRARRAAVEPIIQCALSDLIARSETDQVLNLVDRFGTLPIGGDGFIAQYVRGLRAYRAARDLHQGAAPESASSPTRDPELVKAYLEAADLLAYAFDNPESATFVKERANTGLMLGMALYFKDTPAEASERFEQTTRVAVAGESHAEALWMTVASLERAVESGRTDLEDRLKAAAALFVRTYPGTDRAARLLLRFASEELFDPDRAVEILLELDRESPVYDAARAHAADTIYRAYARSREPQRTEIASRFLPVALGRIESRLDDLRAGNTETVGILLLRARQVLDAALTPLATDAPSARRAFAAIEEVRVRAPGIVADADLAAELAYRRLQLAIVEGNPADEREAYAQLEQQGGDYLEAAARFLFERARAAWAESGDAESARRVVALGTDLLGEGEIERTRLSVADAVARAATELWTNEGDRVMLLAAIDLDRLVLASHTPTSTLLRRLATNAEAAEETSLAQRTWDRLADALPPADPDWFEARHESLRLLALERPAEALVALQQHRVLYPEFGPAPWGDRLEALLVKLESGGQP